MPSVRWAGNTDRCSRHWMPDCMEFIPAVWKEISVICVFMRNCLWKFTTVLRMHRIWMCTRSENACILLCMITQRFLMQMRSADWSIRNMIISPRSWWKRIWIIRHICTVMVCISEKMRRSPHIFCIPWQSSRCRQWQIHLPKDTGSDLKQPEKIFLKSR